MKSSLNAHTYVTRPLLVFCLLALLTPLSDLSSRGQSIPVDGYAALVNQRYINISDVLSIIQPIERQLRQAYEGEELEEKIRDAYDKARETLIERALMVEEFKRQNGSIPDKVVEDRIDEIVRERFDGNRSAFLQTLSEERLTYDEWREEIREQLIVSLLRQKEVGERITVSPSAVYDLYQLRLPEYQNPERVKLRMIVINMGSNEEDRKIKKKEAQHLLQKLIDGEDFGTLAKTYSEGGKASKGGDWGWIEPEMLKEDLRITVATMQPGEFSSVVDLEKEFYIMKLEARQSSSVTPFSEIRSELAKEVRREEAERLYTDWIGRLRNKHFVKVFEN